MKKSLKFIHSGVHTWMLSLFCHCLCQGQNKGEEGDRGTEARTHQVSVWPISAVERFLSFALNTKRPVQVTAIPGREQVNLQGTQSVMTLLTGSCSPAASWNLSFPASKERIWYWNRNFSNQSTELFCPERFYRKHLVIWNVTGLRNCELKGEGGTQPLQRGFRGLGSGSSASPVSTREGKVCAAGKSLKTLQELEVALTAGLGLLNLHRAFFCGLWCPTQAAQLSEPGSVCAWQAAGRAREV